VLITGAAGGLGLPLVRLLAGRGWHVFACDLTPAGDDDTGRVTWITLDVTDPDSVAGALAAVRQRTDGLDAVVNFAGVLAVAAAIEVDEATLRRIFEVNVFGTYRVNKAFFPLLLARRGRIVNMSSETGHQSGGPFNAPYAMSKHAIEAYSDSLRRELGLLGIPVVKIQPGPFRTGMVGDLERQFEQLAAASTSFGPTIRRLAPLIATEQRKAADPDVLAAVVYGALVTPRPKAAYSVKQDPRRAFLELLPARWADAILQRILRSGS
jgi:NAD(P)-dependent dehydrogenase (short-subunit alcohol dehydrogenase family)